MAKKTNDEYRLAHNKSQVKYKQSNDGKLTEKKYQASTKGKVAKAKYAQSKKGKSVHDKYEHSEKGKLAKAISHAKHRRMDDIPLFENPFPASIKVEWHHVSNEFTLAVPKDMHDLYKGYNRDNHRNLVMNIISQIYFR